MKSRSFVDRVVVYARAGNGGNGCCSFRREKFIPNGGPDGGDGGRGGHVIFRGEHDEDSLIRLYFTPHQRARHAGHGKGKKMHGENGADCIIKVPRGTQIYDRESGALLGDIVEHGQELMVARGGKGGKGNVHWKRSTHQAPMEHTDGIPGEELTLQLELKIMADIGLVGFPNAGKSSLLRATSHAKPKIGAYPFTTLNPIIGTMPLPDYTSVRIADIPGLIEGAHEGIGLGHDFLRHIERSRFLVFVIDMAGTDGREPWDDLKNLRNELRLHNPELLDRPFILVANKMDVDESVEKLAEFIEKTGEKPIEICAELEEGIEPLRCALLELIKKARDDEAAEAAAKAAEDAAAAEAAEDAAAAEAEAAKAAEDVASEADTDSDTDDTD